MTMYGLAPVRLSEFPLNYEKNIGEHTFCLWKLLKEHLLSREVASGTFCPLCCGAGRGELGRECSEEKGMSGKPRMASEMLRPGNAGIAIKGTVWISQGVPCPMSIVTCYTEQLG